MGNEKQNHNQRRQHLERLTTDRSIHVKKRAPANKELFNLRKQLIADSFYYSVLPETGYFCVVKRVPLKDEPAIKGKGKLHHFWFERSIDAFRFIKETDSEGVQLYIAQASFKKRGTEDEGRTQNNAAFLRNLFMDIDCGKDKNGKPKPYPTQADGKMALLSFCNKTGLPIPAIVNSGNGLYAHWPLVTEVDAETWKDTALSLKKLVKAIDRGLDNDGLIADSARILRPVGSTHRKDPTNPKRVKLIRDCQPITFDKFKVLIDKAIASLLPPPESTVKVHTQVTENAADNKSSSAIAIAEKCPVIAHIKETKGDVSEPLWYAAIGVLRHCVESPTVIHEWSSGHPGYSIEETDAKIAQHNMPPTTCSLFSEHCPELCKACEHNGKIKSPISLGYKASLANIPEYIAKLNAEYFVGRFSGKTVVCREAYDDALGRGIIETSSFNDFRNFHNNQRVTLGTDKTGSPNTIPLGNAWLDHESRRQYWDIKMLPEGTSNEKIFNLWRGFSVKAAKGSWELMQRHIYRVICCSDKKLYKYVIRWVARMIQEPWTPGEVALVLQGGKGVGKGMLGNAICRIMGQHACHVMSIKDVTGDYNSHLEDCVFFFADEAFWAGDKSAEGVLKGMITEPTVFVHRKYCDKKHVRNMLHLFMASNNDWVVPASFDERRYCVLNVSNRFQGDSEYFKALTHETNNGGLGAMLYYLQNLDISDFDVRVVPQTAGLAEQKIQSLDTVMQWWYQKLLYGELLPDHEWQSVPCSELYDDYVAGVQKLGGNIRRVNDTVFGIQLHKALPEGWPKKPRHSSADKPGKRMNCYEFPKLKECRKHFEKVLGYEIDWG